MSAAARYMMRQSRMMYAAGFLTLDDLLADATLVRTLRD